MFVFMSQENNSLITIVALKVKVMTIVGNSVGRFGNILTCMIPSVKPPLPSGVQTALCGSYGLARSFLRDSVKREPWKLFVMVETQKIKYLLVALLTTR